MKEAKLSLVLWSNTVSIYSPIFEGELETEFQKFMSKYSELDNKKLQSDFNTIIATIEKIMEVGAHENLFRPEGKVSDGVSALPLLCLQRSKNDERLRLYCLRIDDNNLVPGNGTIKHTRTTQEDAAIQQIISELQNLDKAIKECLRKGVLIFSQNKIENLENITFYI